MAINTIATALRNTLCDAFVDAIDDDTGAGYIEIGDSSFDSAGAGTLLATLTFTDPAFGAASSGVATADTITSDTSCNATGTAAVFVVCTSSGTHLFFGTVGTSGADINFDSVAFSAGTTISISSGTITMPAS